MKNLILLFLFAAMSFVSYAQRYPFYKEYSIDHDKQSMPVILQTPDRIKEVPAKITSIFNPYESSIMILIKYGATNTQTVRIAAKETKVLDENKDGTVEIVTGQYSCVSDLVSGKSYYIIWSDDKKSYCINSF